MTKRDELQAAVGEDIELPVALHDALDPAEAGVAIELTFAARPGRDLDDGTRLESSGFRNDETARRARSVFNT